MKLVGCNTTHKLPLGATPFPQLNIYSIQNWLKEQEGQKKDSPWLFRMGLWYWPTPSRSNTSHEGY